MGSAIGYEYEYRFWVDDDILHRYSGFTIRDGIKFVFEMRTNFRLKGGDGDVVIDAERFEIGSENCKPLSVRSLMHHRLIDDYWFSREELWTFACEACAIAAAAAAAADDERRVIPIAVEMDVRTVRRAGESIADAMERAIRSEKLFPLSLMYNRNAFVNVEKSPYHDLIPFLRSGINPKYRVQEVKYFGFMGECSICRRGPRIGDQISILENFCGHAFHYHCLLTSLLTNTCCPRCLCPISQTHIFLPRPDSYMYKLSFI